MKCRITRNNLKLVIVFMTIIMSQCLSCKKNENSDFYYVKYEADSDTRHIGKLNVVVSEKDSTKSFLINLNSKWETTIGPVEEGFNASIDVSKSGLSDLKIYTKISVSKNNEPFVVKMIDDSNVYRNSVFINYIVGN